MPRIILYTDNYNDRVGISSAYVSFLEQFGDVILVTANNNLGFFLEHGDILAMPGGADIDPLRYHEAPRMSGRANVHFEYLDEFLLKPWIETGKPIIGICRGMQSLNVALGGSLYQHIVGHIGGENRAKCEDALFTDIPGYQIYFTNSYHHQAVKKLGEGLEVIGWSPVWNKCPSLRDDLRPFRKYHFKVIKEKDKAGRIARVKNADGQVINYFSHVEIIKHVDRPYLGFQYHPEEFNCDLAIKLIEEVILKKTKKYEKESEESSVAAS